MTQVFVGKVTSNKMIKSVVVTVEYYRKLRKYHVWRRFQSKIMAHDPLNECQMGDTVRIRSCRPLSKRKAFQVVELIHRAKQLDAAAKMVAEHQSAFEARKAEERRIALQNELVSRRHMMDQIAIEQAEKEMAKVAPLIDRFNATQQAIQENIQAETYSNVTSPPDDSTEALTALGDVRQEVAESKTETEDVTDSTEVLTALGDVHQVVAESNTEAEGDDQNTPLPSAMAACTPDVTSPPDDSTEALTALGDVRQEVAEAKTDTEGDEEAAQPGLGLDKQLTEENVAQSDDPNKDAT